MSVPNDPVKTLKYLKAVFVVVVGLLFLLIAATPFLVHGGISLADGFIFEEEVLEAILIVALFAVAYLASRVYRRAVEGYRKKLLRLTDEKTLLVDRLTDAFRYIGTINVQLQEIHAVFSALKRVPENRRQFKNLLASFAGKIIGMVNAEWVLIRIIDRRNLRTLVEHRQNRNQHPAAGHPVGNKAVLEGKKIDGLTIRTGTKDNLYILTACILPLDQLQKQETILLEALVDTVEMLFIIANLYPDIVSEERRPKK
jgi:hypothetical protein